MRVVDHFRSTFIWVGIIGLGFLIYFYVGYHAYTMEDVDAVAASFQENYSLQEKSSQTGSYSSIPGQPAFGKLYTFTEDGKEYGLTIVLTNSDHRAQQQVLSSLRRQDQVAKIREQTYAASETHRENITSVSTYHGSAAATVMSTGGIPRSEATSLGETLHNRLEQGIDAAKGNILALRPLHRRLVGEEKTLVSENDLQLQPLEELGMTEEAKQALND